MTGPEGGPVQDEPVQESLQQAPPRVPERSRARRTAVVLVGVLFLFLPAAAHVSGVRASQIENRELAVFPSPGQGWEFFPRLSTWATDHLPLRDRAVQANTALSEGVFGEPPQYGTPAAPGGAGPVAPQPDSASAAERVFPEVLQGRDDWLFYGTDVAAACEPDEPAAQTLARLSRLGELLRSAGKTWVLTVAPDKSTMVPDRLPESYVGDDCAPQGKQRLWDELRERPPVGYVDLRAALLRVQRTEDTDVWRPSDTHWAPRGALVYAQVLATALDPQLWRTSRPTATGPVQLGGDLASLLGAARSDEVDGWRLERDGVRVVEETTGLLRSVSTGAPLYRPETLVLGDSFTQSSRAALAPLFASARVVHPQAAVDQRPEAVDAVVAADTVVLEIVERSLAGGDVPAVDEAFLAALEQALAAAAGGPAD